MEHIRRDLPGFERFLRPLPFEELAASAIGGPVVLVNVSDLGCHAIVVRSGSEPEIVALPGLTRGEAVKRANKWLGAIRVRSDPENRAAAREAARQNAVEVLKWLWDKVAGPIAQHLGLDAAGPGQPESGLPRIWWMPTGPLSVLPLHAAGHYPLTAPQADEPEWRSETRTMPSRAVSSYATTLRSLSQAPKAGPDGPDPSMAFIGMPESPVWAPKANPLPGVLLEKGSVAAHFPEASAANAYLIQDRATAPAAIAAIESHSWAHFSCHGSSGGPDPSQAGFALADRWLTMEEIAALHLPNSEFAFLSACLTAANPADLLDEAYHLTGAMQMVGFRHVIGTMWPVADMFAAQVAGQVYAALAAGRTPTPGQAARTLHAAVASVKANSAFGIVGNPLIWATLMHTGP
ncbi:MAG: CHAT domain-containing protein [Bifidobacteriaceae bacterium]|nr:CHAT domain-containing protein [Bifidobacteriaceae bacterium]